MATQVVPWSVALAKANGVRTQRARLKREVREDRAVLVRLIMAAPDDVGSARVYDFVIAARRIRHTRAQRIFRHAGVPTHRLFRSLTERERVALAEQLV